MPTKVKSLPKAAGIKCPKKTGGMGKDQSCRECPYYSRCMGTIMEALGVVI